MPWKETDEMDQKKAFILRSFERDVSFTELCKDFGISTKTGYKWKERFFDLGWKGLQEESRKPNRYSNYTSEYVVVDLLTLKNHHQKWGSRKILKLYKDKYPGREAPALSTVERLFKRVGLTQPRKRKRYPESGRIQNRIIAEKPNDLWTVDFKGWWYTPEKEQVNPLTIRDDYSKFILAIAIVDKGNISCVRKEFEKLFLVHGLPQFIRSDNGPPFACTFNKLGLTKLSVWWMSLGILLDRIDPGCPYQNGAHERMHLDMKKELEGHIYGDLKEHQKVFDIWREEFNTLRPHEALGMRCPVELYKKSERKYEPDVVDVEYSKEYIKRKVNDRGYFNLLKKRYFIGNPFAGYSVGIKYIGKGKPEIWFASVLVGNIDQETGTVEYIIAVKE
jgi:transposase InsO family protein